MNALANYITDTSSTSDWLSNSSMYSSDDFYNSFSSFSFIGPKKMILKFVFKCSFLGFPWHFQFHFGRHSSVTKNRV